MVVATDGGRRHQTADHSARWETVIYNEISWYGMSSRHGRGEGTRRCESGRRVSASRRSYLRLAGAAGVTGLAGCLGGLGGGGGGSGPIKLGTAFPFTGPYSEEAETQRHGVELAVNEINENGGLLDRDVEVVERDTELDGETSTRRVRDLIENENIDLLVANLSGGLSLQTNVEASNTGVPYMAACQTIPDFHAPDFLGEGSFTPYALNVQTQRAMMNYVYENLGKSVFGVVADYAWGNSSWTHAKAELERLGGEVSGVVKTPLGTSDFSSQLSTAADSGADVLILMNFGTDQANSLKQAREFGLHRDMDVYVSLTTATIAQRAGRDQWENVHAGMQYYHGADNQNTDAFAQAMQEAHDYPGDTYAAVSYTGVKELERAVNATGSLEVSDIASHLEENPEFAHTKTTEKWRACDNQSIQDWFIVKGKPAGNQGSEWDIFEIVDSFGGTKLLPACDKF